MERKEGTRFITNHACHEQLDDVINKAEHIGVDNWTEFFVATNKDKYDDLDSKEELIKDVMRFTIDCMWTALHLNVPDVEFKDTNRKE